MTLPASPASTAWQIDPAHSTVHFSVRHLMITTVHGRFHDIEGTLRYDADDLAHASVSVRIPAARIDTGVADRDQHLRSADFLETDRFPVIAFESTRVEGAGRQFALTGDLTIHGVTRAVTLQVALEGRGDLPGGGARIGFSATTRLDRREFGLTWNQALEAGGILVGHEISVQLDVQATLAGH